MARISPLIALPPLAFAGLAAVFLWGLDRSDPTQIPSALIGREAPAVPTETLPGKTLLTPEALRTGKVTVVNFWASWCPPCRAEHPTLTNLAAQGIPVAGVNFKDNATDAQKYLKDEGDPYFALGYDPRGRSALDWGVSAPPETFILDGQGRVLYRFAGPLVGDDLRQRFLPELEKAQRENGQSGS
ncbi:DsbE family thiol:disulfide interchange protein [Paracoccus pacificus]|uniref:DsbE family thiol:disulfide interchange protein n=1 Tax=Paracoccus pacificus TaxID=1463598 RepID=A0ABW4R5X3_9RHOB